ncbi:MAG: hypothetical protein EOP09_13495 [Proteobacteria bacterium]|nr:MAG: hypothetical protein EOP09_13495 [Pseudomonadota bacterium]
MKSFLRKLGFLILLAVSLTWLYTKLMWPSSLLDLPEIHAHMTAKEVCSCIFVEEQTPERCKIIHHHLFEPTSLEIDREQKFVFARSFWSVAKANFKGDEVGCGLEY